jgi:hypothetical protein
MTKSVDDITNSVETSKKMYAKIANVESAVAEISDELFGLEHQAQSCLNQMNMYLNLPGLMRQPLILNFWGSTGTGKTQLVKRLVELAGLDKRFVQVNLANTGASRWNAKMAVVSELVDAENSDALKPVVLFFDEMQHARTINEKNEEIQQNDIADLWGILENGVEFVTGKRVQTIIFLAGNIDLYDEENIKNWEGLPNEEQQSVNVPIQLIHDTLSKRFRPEMLARLRNNHFVFPPIDKQRAQKIIERDLSEMGISLKNYYSNLKLTYDDAFITFLFNHIQSKGMGARGIESKINEIIKSRIGPWLLMATERGYNTDAICELRLLGVDQEIMVHIKMNDDVEIDHVDSIKIKRNYSGSNCPEEIAVYAVHEAGHALASFIAGGSIPSLISVGSSVGNIKAFVNYASYKNTTSKKDIMNRISTGFGGLLAEEILFGKNDTTLGSDSDLLNLFNLASRTLMESGLGSSFLVRKLSSGFFDDAVPHYNNSDRCEIELFIHRIGDQTRSLLVKQKYALKVLAQQIFYRGELTSEEFMEIMEHTINKALFAKHHGISHIDERGNKLSAREIAQSLDFNYVHALFGQADNQASKNALIGLNGAREKKLLFNSEFKRQSEETTLTIDDSDGSEQMSESLQAIMGVGSIEVGEIDFNSMLRCLNDNKQKQQNHNYSQERGSL